MSVSARTIVFDFADNYGDYLTMNVRAIEFWLEGVRVEVVAPPTIAVASSFYNWRFYPIYAFLTAKPKTGPMADNSWGSASYRDKNQRLYVVRDTPIVFDEIRVENGHHDGGYTSRGVKNTKIYHTDAQWPNDYADHGVYGSHLDELTLIFDVELAEHIPADVEHPQILSLSPASQVVEAPPFVLSASLTLEFVPPPAGITPPPFKAALTLVCVARTGAVLVSPPFLLDTKLSASLAPLVRQALVFRARQYHLRPALSVLLRINAPPSLTNVAVVSPPVVYLCTVTGAEAGLQDLQVPISSFLSRRRSGTPSSLWVKVPGVGLYNEIMERASGDLVVSLGAPAGGELARVSLRSIDLIRGRSITLVGAKQTTYTEGKTVEVLSVTSRSFYGGRWRVRAPVPDASINPGDTILTDDVSFVAGLVATSVSIDPSGGVSGTQEMSEM